MGWVFRMGVAAAIVFIAGAFLGPYAIAVGSNVFVYIKDKSDPYVVLINDQDSTQGQNARFVSSTSPAPLVVDLHEWSQDETGSFGGADPLIDVVQSLGWNYIRPALAGPNNHPGACCSDLVLSRIETAISFAKERGAVDPERIFVVGVSGGGYTALCAMLSDRFKVASWSIWVPISDLVRWYRFHRTERYGEDILACTGSTGGKLNIEEAEARSPINMSVPDGIADADIRIYAGINDGWRGSVPITHSIDMFNKLAESTGRPESVVPQADTLRLLTMQYDDEGEMGDGRRLLYRRQAGNIHLGIFDGAHEGLTSEVVKQITGTP